MSDDSISMALRQFIAQHIYSVEQLEILCILNRYPLQSLQISDIFRKIQTNETSIFDRLTLFVSAQIATAEPDGGYRLSPKYQALVTELDQAYRERQMTMLDLIYKRPATSAQDFSEAFRIKKKKE